MPFLTSQKSRSSTVSELLIRKPDHQNLWAKLSEFTMVCLLGICICYVRDSVMCSTGSLSCNLFEDVFGREHAGLIFLCGESKRVATHPSRYHLVSHTFKYTWADRMRERLVGGVRSCLNPQDPVNSISLEDSASANQPQDFTGLRKLTLILQSRKFRFM